MSFLPRRWRHQPQTPLEIDWSNPITKSLVFAAVPYPAGSPYFIDLVTKTRPDTVTGTFTPATMVRKTGKSLESWITGVQGSADCALSWPVSESLRGGSSTTAKTLLCLGGTPDQTNNNIYTFGGNSETVVSGGQPILGIDSFLISGTGNVMRLQYNASNVGLSANEAINNPFDNQIHLFGYSFQDSGDNGDFFYGKTIEAYTGFSDFSGLGVTGNRRARLFHAGQNGAQTKENGIIAMFLIWDRRITGPEYMSLYQNPWQLFRPYHQNIYVNISGGVTAYSIAAGTWTAGGTFADATLSASTGGFNYTINALPWTAGATFEDAARDYYLLGGGAGSFSAGATFEDATLTFAQHATNYTLAANEWASGATFASVNLFQNLASPSVGKGNPKKRKTLRRI